MTKSRVFQTLVVALLILFALMTFSHKNLSSNTVGQKLKIGSHSKLAEFCPGGPDRVGFKCYSADPTWKVTFHG